MVNRLPSDLYSEQLKKENIKQDQRQLYVLKSFDRLSLQLKTLSYPRKLLSFFIKNKPKFNGIYLWGSVGIGKTFLMDCFFESLSTSRKRRIHFHHFMQEVHIELQQYSGQRNPLTLLAKQIKNKIDVLCLDEFFVSDIIDAMLLANLLQALFDEKICFVTTSNISPNLLYKDGLQRESFLPAIKLLEQKLEIIHLSSTIDYRLLYLQSAGVYYTPLNKASENQLDKAFELYSHNDVSIEPLIISERRLAVIKSSSEAGWFDFEVLCGAMRCKQDYLELAERFSLILLSNVPVLTHRSLDEVTRFIQLVDIFYDAKIKVIISAEVLPSALYTEGKLVFAFQRTVSRLIEMQSAIYFKEGRQSALSLKQ